MRRNVVTVALFVFAIVPSITFIRQVDAQPPGGPGMGRPPMGMMGAPIDSFVAERDSLVKVLLAGDYAGKASMPAESVFQSLKVVKGRTVEQVLRMMDFGFGRSLGVRCQHCHVLGHWADEDKPTKQVARDMMGMTSRINGELLTNIKNLKSDHPGINCSTCHRGTARPGTGPMGVGGPGGRR